MPVARQFIARATLILESVECECGTRSIVSSGTIWLFMKDGQKVRWEQLSEWALKGLPLNFDIVSKPVPFCQACFAQRNHCDPIVSRDKHDRIEHERASWRRGTGGRPVVRIEDGGAPLLPIRSRQRLKTDGSEQP